MKCAAAAFALLLATAACQTKPSRITGVDWEVVRRTEAQLQALQLRYQNEAQPIILEHDTVVNRYCQQAGLTAGPTGDCAINPQTGEVTKRAAQAQSK